MKSRISIALCMLIPSVLLTSCLDMIFDKSKRVVGQIFPNYRFGQKPELYSLAFAIDSTTTESSGGGFIPIVHESVFWLAGNDSVLYVAAVDQLDTMYYAVHHNAGKSYKEARKISKPDYATIKKDAKYQWTYEP